MTSPLSRLPGWQQALLIVAAAKLVGGLLAVGVQLVVQPGSIGTRLPVFGLYQVLFAAGAALLLFGSRGNRAATPLGAMFLLVSASWGDAPILGLARLESFGETWTWLSSVRVDAFHPYFLWLFVGLFPRGELLGRRLKMYRWGARLSLWVGAFLLAANLLMLLGRWMPALAVEEALGWARVTSIGVYWSTLYLLDTVALGFLITRARRARAAERRRVGLFVGALAAGAAPMLVLTIAEPFVPAITRLWESPRGSLVLLLVIDVALLSIPLTTAYSVLVHRVVDLRWVLRRAMQYTLARYTALAAATLPLLLLVGLLYRNRDQTVSSILTSRTSLALLGLAVVGTVALGSRASWLRALDRRFFREEYDAARILTNLAERLRACESRQMLWDPLRDELRRSLCPVSLDLLLRTPGTGELASISGEGTVLPSGGPLLSVVASSGGPFECELERFDDEWSRLSESELDWLADGEYRLLLPISQPQGELLGVLALGPKESELPYSREDRQLLIGIATAVGLVVETRFSVPTEETAAESTEQTRTLPDERAVDEIRERGGVGLARACTACGRVWGAWSEQCDRCGGNLKELNLPRVVRGKFLLERLVGRGGMGVVFLARDLDLGRQVAIKSLPRVSAKYSGALRSEARAMAAVTHPNLALIFGAESYRRLPLLVFEYLAGGSLSARIREGPLPVARVLEIGEQMADVTDTIHRAGILHRDIKPSNIGFTADRTPKLLDFGLARLVQAAGLESAEVLPASGTRDGWSRPRRVAGTTVYLSPEAIRGRAPDYWVDLWSLSLTLYEALTGTNPFRGVTTEETLAKIETAAAPDPREYRPDCPAELADLLARALAKDLRRRPASARALGQALKKLVTLMAA